jgi:aminoglycoside phosphotransferase family enzyme/predicted kinase
MSEPRFYPGAPEVTVCETHTAWVFLAGAHAYKVKKPVRMAFLDFGTLGRRRAVCREEVRLNRELAPTLDLRLRAVVAAGSGYALADAGAPDPVEYVIQMRRFDERRTMSARVRRGALTGEDVRAVAARVAAFHADARVVTPADPAGDVTRAWDHSVRELLAIADDATALRVLAADRFASAFVVRHRAGFAARGAGGRVRDGHGDLRAEHVVLESPLAIVDRLEFDARLREIDVADDLAFLAMDLEALGAGDAARRLVAAYRAAGGDPGSEALVAFYGVYRALVRAKVGLLRAAQLGDGDGDGRDGAGGGEGAGGGGAAADALTAAHALIDLAERLAWRARGPLVLAVGGPPASGKSTVAAGLARRSGWEVLSSDVQRKRGRGMALDAAAPDEDYTPAARAAVYRSLGERARERLDAGDGAIVDATFGDARLRAAFLDGFGTPARLRAIECVTPPALRERWAGARRADTARGSDATPHVAAALAARHSGWSELPERALLCVRPGAGADEVAGQVADWLDRGACVVCPAGARPDTDGAGDVRA